MKCAATQNRKSDEQCKSNALCDGGLCGRHIKSKSPRLWVDVMSVKATKLPKAQAMIRGYLVRIRLKNAGPGVLKRSVIVNDEDCVTYTDKNKVHPFDYFAFEEGGKIWFFEFSTIWDWCRRSFRPTNPYTKSQLTIETKSRLREIWRYRDKYKHPIPPESNLFSERLMCRWNSVCQVIHDHGFDNIHPNLFIDFGPREYYHFFQILKDEILKKKMNPYEMKLVSYCNTGVHLSSVGTYYQSSLFSLLMLMRMLTLCHQPYEFIFRVVSALYRS